MHEPMGQDLTSSSDGTIRISIMSDYSLMRTRIFPAFQYAEKHPSPIVARCVYLGLCPCSFIVGVVDTVAGLKGNKRRIESSKLILAAPYFLFLRAINPHAKLCNDVQNGFMSPASKKLSNQLPYGLWVIATLVARVADAIIGMLAAVASICFLGTREDLNNTAFIAFQGSTYIA